jgi:dethiobiotin synthetase
VSEADWRGPVLVTGTDTGVGKTVVTAGLAAAASAIGLRVAVLKPAESGVSATDLSDVDAVVQLAAPATARTFAQYPHALAPLAAARLAGEPPLELYSVVDAIRAEAKSHDLVLVEGAGGLLVPMGVRPSGQPWTVADLAVSLGAPAVVVARAGLGTLNHTALTMEALDVEVANLVDLYTQLAGAVPAGAGSIEPGVFRRSAPGWFTARLFGTLDDVRSLIEPEL